MHYTVSVHVWHTKKYIEAVPQYSMSYGCLQSLKKPMRATSRENIVWWNAQSSMN